MMAPAIAGAIIALACLAAVGNSGARVGQAR